jgi:dihydropteroate synthase
MRDWRRGAGLLMVDVDTLAAADHAASQGADILAFGPGPERPRPGDRARAELSAARQRFPDLGLAVRADSAASAAVALDAGADLLDVSQGVDPALLRLAADRGTALVCAPATLPRAVALGLARERLAVAARDVRSPGGGLAELRGLLETGSPVLVTLDEPAHLTGAAAPSDRDAGLVAAVAICAWLGVRIYRTGSLTAVRELRQTLDMVASIRGDRPPALARRALA